MKNLRITIRIENENREQLDRLVREGKINSVSQAVRTALELYLKDWRVKDYPSK